MRMKDVLRSSRSGQQFFPENDVTASSDIVMPKLGLTMTEGVLSEWCVGPGDRVRAGQVLCIVETEKIANDVEATSDGEIIELLAQPGENVDVGAAIARWRTDQAGGSGTASVSSAQFSEAAAASDDAGSLPGGNYRPANSGSVSRIKATPLARRLAEARGVDLAGLTGTGPVGRIKAADVVAVVREPDAGRVSPSSSVAKGSAAIAAADTPSAGERRPLSAVESVVARRLSAAKRDIPHFYVGRDADLIELESTRARLNSRGGDLVKVSVTHMLIAAVARALGSLPELNRVWEDASVLTFSRVDIGVAVETPRGLMVPVIRDVGPMTLDQVAARSAVLVTRARQGKLSADEIGGGSISVSNLGMFGVGSVTPIVNPGQAAILGVGAARPVFRPDEAGRPALRKEMTMVLACDHRILDGAAAARLLARIVELLEQPADLLQSSPGT